MIDTEPALSLDRQCGQATLRHLAEMIENPPPRFRWSTDRIVAYSDHYPADGLVWGRAGALACFLFGEKGFTPPDEIDARARGLLSRRGCGALPPGALTLLFMERSRTAAAAVARALAEGRTPGRRARKKGEVA